MRRVVVVVIAFLVAAGLALGWYLTRSRTGPLPSTDPAAVSAIWIEDATRPGWPKHVVAPTDYARVLRLFEGGVPDPSPATTLTCVGRVTIVHRDGRIRTVELFRTGGGPGAYLIVGFAPGAYSEVGVDTGSYRGWSDEEVAAAKFDRFYGTFQIYYRGASDEEIVATLAACLQRTADRPAE